MGPIAKLLPCGTRLHLQHGPIDLIIGAEGERRPAFDAARARFATVLEELVHELPILRTPVSDNTPPPKGRIARRMHAATTPFSQSYVTPMAAVAGAVADEVLHAMIQAADLHRAYVNNGGDIALHLGKGAQFVIAMQGHDGQSLGNVTLTDQDCVRGISTSVRQGRSLSLVDDSDLGAQLVVTHCAALSATDSQTALHAGKTRALQFRSQKLISAAGLFLQGHVATTSPQFLESQRPECLYA